MRSGDKVKQLKEHTILEYVGDTMQEEKKMKKKEEECLDLVNFPPHYNQSMIQPIDVIEDWDLNYNLGNLIKYISRYRYKGSPLQDLQKAQWYLERAISVLERGETSEQCNSD